ncbi:MAG TPA: DegT/DnrJ/EryC1/StrS family aminotransferase [bacterium]|nr:DegT/DnrJ/EryC1/StrS family aminotransferase [bacterium]HPS29967.1 DegT/DnrJ/EryC1/StrS family aminotransferase [bacterium]
MIKFLDLKRQYGLLKNEIDAAVLRVFEDGSFIKGAEVGKFEHSFAKYCEASHCITCGNGTDGLSALLKAFDLPKNSTVIVPANTFIATAEAVVSIGLKVKFADISDDYTVSPESVESLIDDSVSAVIAVHLYGQPARIDELRKITQKRGIVLIEDAAQAHGAMLNGQKAGSLADGAVFSFYPGKVLGAAGDAGAVVLNNDKIAEKVRKYCDHGRSDKYIHQFAGINSRMDTIQATVLNVKLKYLENWIDARNEVASIYLKLIKEDCGIILPRVRHNVRHSWHLFVIKTEKRDKLKKYLESEGIECGIHYPVSLPQQPAFIDECCYAKNYQSLKDSKMLLSIPIGEHLRKKDVSEVSEKINNFFE